MSAAQFDSTTVYSDGVQGVNLTGTNAVLHGITGSVDFRGVNLSSVSFMGSDLSGAQFDGTTIFSAHNPQTGQQQGVNLSGTNAVLSTIMASNVDFRGVNLSGVSFMGSDLSFAQFDSTTVYSDGTQGVNLSGTNAVISGIQGFENINFSGVNLSGVSFMGSDLSLIHI